MLSFSNQTLTHSVWILLKKMSALKTSLIVLWSSICLSTAVAADREVGLTLGVYTSDKPTTMYAKFKPILHYLESQIPNHIDTPVQLKLRIFKNYTEARQALVQNHVDFVRFGPASYIVAQKENPHIRLLAVEERHGKLKFQGAIFTTEESPIKSLKDLQGKRFAFGNRHSTIGRYLAQQELLNAGISSTDLHSFAYLDRHDKVVQLVALGKFSAGSAKKSSLRKVKGLRIIRSFDNPSKPWIARSTMSDSLFLALQTSLIKLTDKKTLQSLCKKCTGFRLVNHQFFDSTKQAIEVSTRFTRAQ